MRLSQHSIDRYRQRVEAVSFETAAMRLEGFSVDATHRGRPRHWTPVVPTPGLTFAYPHARPDVCLLVRADVVVTIIDRASVRRWTERERFIDISTDRREFQPYRRPAPGSLVLGDAA